MAVRILTWNLKHGRAVPSAGRDLLDEFAASLARWEWDVALLQEVPPWWPQPLAVRLDAYARFVLTSRNALLPLRRKLAIRWPDLMKSNGGGANAILVRLGRIEAHRARCLCLLPERRWVHAVNVGGTWYANLHIEGQPWQAQLAAATVRVWAGKLPAVLGGDFNLRSLALPLNGFSHLGGHEVDHVLARGLSGAGDARVLDRGQLSDHAPVLVVAG